MPGGPNVRIREVRRGKQLGMDGASIARDQRAGVLPIQHGFRDFLPVLVHLNEFARVHPIAAGDVEHVRRGARLLDVEATQQGILGKHSATCALPFATAFRVAGCVAARIVARTAARIAAGCWWLHRCRRRRRTSFRSRRRHPRHRRGAHASSRLCCCSRRMHLLLVLGVHLLIASRSSAVATTAATR
jgi:hypothetical protein